MINKDKSFLIIGLGLIGGSYALRLSNLGFKVYAIDINNEALEYAKNKKMIHNDNESNIELINKADYIILCLYPNANVEWIKENKEYIKLSAIISDVSGVKSNYVDVIQNEISNEFISMHPMAGKEKKGVYYSSDTMFIDANMLIIKTDMNSNEGITFALELSDLLGFLNKEIVNIIEHDRIISYLSQLPHAIAVSLMNDRENKSFIKYSGDSFRDLTRIAKINEELWSELFLINKEHLVNDIDSFINTLSHLKESLKNDDKDELKRLFKNSTERRKEFEK